MCLENVVDGIFYYKHKVMQNVIGYCILLQDNSDNSLLVTYRKLDTYTKLAEISRKPSNEAKLSLVDLAKMQ